MELYSVIKNDGPGGLLFWKHGKEDFRTGSQLVVSENEEALFVKDGVIIQTFSGGRFTLKTSNYPFIDRIRSAFSGGENAFHCKVFFVNKADSLDLKWGTDSPIQVRDPVYGIFTSVQGRGSYTIRVQDTKKFVLKYVANKTQAVDPVAVQREFQNAFRQRIKSCIARGIQERGREVLGIAGELDTFAERLSPILADELAVYGLELVNFYVSALDIPTNDPNREKLENAMSSRAEILALGNDWQRVQGRDILMNMANNPGTAGGAAGVGAGLGMGIAAGGAMGAVAASVFSPFATPATPPPPASTAVGGGDQGRGISCANCGCPLPPGAKFCPRCGTKAESPTKLFCANCGHELQSGTKFCPECGTKLP